MDSPSTHKRFIFNSEIDIDFLFSLYENDFRYIQEVFGITLNQLQPDLEQLDNAWQLKDLEGVRRGVHKIKPSMGFVGLSHLQSKCVDFEKLCRSANTATEIEQEFQHLWQSLVKSRDIIETEYRKLKNHNGEA